MKKQPLKTGEETQMTDAERIAHLEQQNADLQKTVDDLTLANASLLKENDALKTPTAPAGSNSIERPTFEFGGRKLQCRVPKFQHKGIEVTATDLAADEELQAELVAKNSELLMEL